MKMFCGHLHDISLILDFIKSDIKSNKGFLIVRLKILLSL